MFSISPCEISFRSRIYIDVLAINMLWVLKIKKKKIYPGSDFFIDIRTIYIQIVPYALMHFSYF